MRAKNGNGLGRGGVWEEEAQEAAPGSLLGGREGAPALGPEEQTGDVGASEEG